jgi:hypothetical protein
MAEGDRLERAFRAGWRSAYRRARNDDAPPAEVADKLVTALARTLRERGGIPGVAESDAPWSALAASFPQLGNVRAALVVREGMSYEDVEARLIRMYRAYVQEWERFPVSYRIAA